MPAREECRMNPFEMVVVIVLITCVAGIINNHIKARSSGDRVSNLDQRLARLETLEQRVQALESIVTDEGFELKQRLNRLGGDRN